MLRPGSRSGLLLAVAGLAAQCTPPGAEHVHDDMPEAAAPITQRSEQGPALEVVRGPDALSGLPVAQGFTVDGPTALPAPASRATVWLTLEAPGDDAPELQVRAGWANGQTAAWKAMTEIGAEGAERVFAADLETAATSVSFRWAPNERLRALRWSASVPLAPERLTGRLGDPGAVAPSAATPRADWGAQPARCGADDTTRQVVLRGALGPRNEAHAARAMQLRDRDGLGWCDARPSYIVGRTSTFVARGDRRAASAATEAGNRGRASIVALACAPDGAMQAQLNALLDALVARHRLDETTRFVAEASPACPDPAALQSALTHWLDTEPFAQPPPPPPPPPATGTLIGLVQDASDPSRAVPGATVDCDCGQTVVTDADGRFRFEPVSPGMHQLDVAKAGFVTTIQAATVRADEVTEVTVQLAPEPPVQVVVDHAFLIDHFGGIDVDPAGFDETQEGFQAYLDAVGVTYFAAWEYVVPNNQAVATSCGYSILLPSRDRWPRAAALGLLADRLRALVNEPVTLRNWWRPDCYNVGVGGAPGGDHPDADALDLDFRSASSRAAAQRYLCDTYWRRDIEGTETRLNMSIGLGGATIHLGLLSRNGRRFWKYSSYSAQPDSGDCW